MQNINVEYTGSELTFNQASSMAIRVARENKLREPAILAWHQREGDVMSPSFAGADPNTWWEKYGAANGGRLEIHIGDRFDFIFTESLGYENLKDIPLRNLRSADGTEFICYAPHDSIAQLDGHACMPLDDWAAKQN